MHVFVFLRRMHPNHYQNPSYSHQKLPTRNKGLVRLTKEQANDYFPLFIIRLFLVGVALGKGSSDFQDVGQDYLVFLMLFWWRYVLEIFMTAKSRVDGRNPKQPLGMYKTR